MFTYNVNILYTLWYAIKMALKFLTIHTLFCTYIDLSIDQVYLSYQRSKIGMNEFKKAIYLL
jgi:hypothetical protein